METTSIAPLKSLTVLFDRRISPTEIPLFRGAVIDTMGKSANQLYHNHDGDKGYRYSYPLIQYKIINGKPAIVFIGEGTDTIVQFLIKMKSHYRIGKKGIEMDLEKIIPEETTIAITNRMIEYAIKDWLPLNETNYDRYANTQSAIERLSLLESILTGNILSMCKGLGINITEELKVSITSYPTQKSVMHKKVRMLSFDLTFNANIMLPNHIGLGKNVSLGCGEIERVGTTNHR